MENIEELDIDIEDIGTILKSSRLKQKKTMEEISSELCIRKIYLTALEEGDYETLPPIPYGVGYVRTYARYLGLNPERAVKLYKSASVLEEVIEEDKKETPEINKSNSWHIIAGVLSLVAIYVGWNLYVMTTSSKTEENRQDEIFVEDVQLENQMTNNLEEELSKEIIPETPEEGDLEKIENTPNIPQTLIKEQQEDEKEVQVPENNKVVLEFLGESWVELKDKKKVYYQGVFHKNDKKEINYTDNLFLSVGRPQNVKIYIKGKEKNILVKRRKMNIPLDTL